MECLTPTNTYCVAVEVGSSPSSKYHLHCYVEFEEKILLFDLPKVLTIFKNNKNFNVQTVHNRKRVLAYISKENLDLYYNCKISNLEFEYQSYFIIIRSLGSREFDIIQINFFIYIFIHCCDSYKFTLI